MEDNAQQFLDSHESVEDIVIQKISAEKLHMALLRLPKKDQELIYALFYEEKTERVYAEQIGVSPSTVHRRREKIIEKLFEIAEQTSHLTANKVRGLFMAA